MSKPPYSIIPVPDDAPKSPAPPSKLKDGKQHVSSSYYRTFDGKPAFVEHRYEDDKGSKSFVMQSFMEGQWQFKLNHDNRPVLGADLLKAYPEKKVLVCEGAKAMSSARTAVEDEFVVVSWSNGATSVRKTDWSPLYGREVILFPDNDENGKKAMEEIKSILLKGDKTTIVKIIDVSDMIPKGDAADLKPAEIARMVHTETPESEDMKFPFRVIAKYGVTYILQLRDGSLYHLKVREIKLLTMLSLTHELFIDFYCTNEDNKFSEVATLQTLEDELRKSSIEWDGSTRKTGIYLDRGRIVAHLGNRLIVDGVESALIEFVDSDYVYEASTRIDIDLTKAMSDDQRSELFNVMQTLYKWSNPLEGVHLLGWEISAMLAGITVWRSHISINGAKGTGKSCLIIDVSKLLGKFAVSIAASSTEASIRQTVGNTTFAVLYDEAEAESKSDKDRMDKNIVLFRQSSSANDAGITRGSSDNSKPIRFVMSSCVLLASIGTPIMQEADLSRYTMLELYKFAKGCANYAEESSRVFNEDNCEAFQATVINNARTIRDSIDVVSAVIGRKYNDARIGDQQGTILGAAFGFLNLRVPTIEEAQAWIEQYPPILPEDGMSDEDELLQYILQSPVWSRSMGESYDPRIREQRLIGDMVRDVVRSTDLRTNLYEYGLTVQDKKWLAISDSHNGMKRILEGTRWERNWKKFLERIPGAKPKGGVKYGTEVGATRATLIPLDYILKW